MHSYKLCMNNAEGHFAFIASVLENILRTQNKTLSIKKLPHGKVCQRLGRKEVKQTKWTTTELES